MSTKKEYTIEELEEQYRLADEKMSALKQQIKQKKKEEAEAREEKLRAEQAARKEEVEAAEKNYRSLLRAYIKDYGSYSTTKSYSASDEIPNLLRMFF